MIAELRVFKLQNRLGIFSPGKRRLKTDLIETLMGVIGLTSSSHHCDHRIETRN